MDYTAFEEGSGEMKLHAQSDFHVESYKAEVETEQVTRRGIVNQKIQGITEGEIGW